MRWLPGLLLLLLLLLTSNLVAAATFDSSYADWNRLLKSHVTWTSNGSASTVDYAGFQAEQAKLEAFLASAAAVPTTTFAAWSKAYRNAFLINVYNAATVELVLTRYPGLESIKDIGGLFGSPWKRDVMNLLGAERGLDDMEHELLRGAADFDEPRIHFAINCASMGCPALRPEAYVASRLAAQLDDQTSRFLQDRSRNRVDPGKGLRVSKIFDWYSEDFDKHAGGVRKFLAGYAHALGLDADAARRLETGTVSISYTDYDWRLNGR